MDNTTLHTFLFHCPTALRTLVLLGSWDNFTRPYSLEVDARRGGSYWRGCFTFSDIICDGDPKDLVSKRNGPLKMGGTYWYYYKVDDDEECHDPSKPSTTVCPLLPGQRLNVLEVPSEGHSRSLSEPLDGFTRNPSDRYLTPVPPAPLKPLPSPRLSSASPGASPMPPPSPWMPRSATIPQTEAFLSPNVVRHARSVSASPHMPSTPLFADFRSLKDKLAAKRAASRARSSSKSQELDIGSPVLISTTNGDLNLIPLASYRSAPTSATREAHSANVSPVRPVPTIRREFSPLTSHPVNPDRDSLFAPRGPLVQTPKIERRRSHIPSTIVTSEFRLGQGRIRANSADTRRTQHYLFSNDPWLSSPKLEEDFGWDAPEVVENMPPMPTLQRPSSLAPPNASERPTSRHGESRSPSLRHVALDKELPELPQCVTPVALATCHYVSPAEMPTAEELMDEYGIEDLEDDEVLGDLIQEYEEKPRSHFSTWSSDSMAYTCSTLDDEAVYSPTLGSLTSNSESGSPQTLSPRFSYADADQHDRTPTIIENILDDQDDEPQYTPLSASPPKLDDLRISTFGSDLFSLDIQHAEAAPRRQAACFGLGFHYSLPEDDTTSKATITESSLRIEPVVQRESSASQLNVLMNEFGYLGDAVI
ncbi:hypothetical protein FB567DRAFT_114579 [Paraphoma chrysanthemicola]|uniref:Uncharacterized protein n=1 Tax=Paraphoma chrysanthemicola TaxID=798071 RepID=A0A8K0VVS5_9PLEO|nr:hypothetical protein FB567DRAFT_114579 [Paraphoma chrysanthemicola]